VFVHVVRIPDLLEEELAKTGLLHHSPAMMSHLYWVICPYLQATTQEAYTPIYRPQQYKTTYLHKPPT
jgi:hypothetical protein